MRPTRRWISLEPPTITLVGHDGLLWDEIGPARTTGSKKGSLIDRPSCGQPAGQKIIVGLVGCSSGSADDPKSAIGELVGKVREHPFVMVVGRSGSGKSSLIYALMLSYLSKKCL
jgi:ABC-type multidrug transport system fused ATPase/permease subunit